VPGAEDGRDGAWAHAWAGELARCQADLAGAEAHALAAHSALKRNPDEMCSVVTLSCQAAVASDGGDLQRAQALHGQARALSRRAGLTEQEAGQAAFLSNVLLLQGDVDTAERLASEALELADRAASRWARVWAQLALGQAAAARGDLEVARRLLEEVVDFHRATC